MSGCTASGNLADEKKTPEEIHIGSMTTFMRPDTTSTLRGRAEISKPSESRCFRRASTLAKPSPQMPP